MKHLIKLIFLVVTLNLSAQETAKIYTEGNYFFIETGDRIYEGLSKDVLVKKLETTSTEFFFNNINSFPSNQGIELADMVDGTGTPYTAGSWETFYTENTGNFNAGGGDGKLGSQTPEEVALAMYVDVTAALAGGLLSKQLYHTGDYILRMIP